MSKMPDKLFWWGPIDTVNNQAPLLWYTDRFGGAMQEFDPNYGQFSAGALLADGYTEISWKTARAMGAPV